MNIFGENSKIKKVWIIGAARSGIACAKLLKSLNFIVVLSDKKKIESELKSELMALNIEIEEGEHDINKIIKNCDVMVISPVILRNSKLVMECLKVGKSVLSEVEIATRYLNTLSCYVAFPPLCIAVTGTNGKSTVTNYISHCLERNAYPSRPCGNFGVAFSALISNSEEYKRNKAYVLELSSYQLESTYSLRPKLSIILNLQEDHLARYKEMDTYLKAKWRLVLLTDDDGVVVIDEDVLKRALYLGLSLPKAEIIITNYSSFIENNVDNDIDLDRNAYTLSISYYHNNEINILNLLKPLKYSTAFYSLHQDGSFEININCYKKKIIKKINKPCILGEHNIKNILAATSGLIALGFDAEKIFMEWEEQSSTYNHIAHRLEIIKKEKILIKDNNQKLKNLTIINDSKATNIQSLIVALNSFNNRRVRLLIGGEPKDEDFSIICDYFNKPVIKFYPFGAARFFIYNILQTKQIATHKPEKSLFEATNIAINEAFDDDIILLSPACASFDEFLDFEDRGNKFKSFITQFLQ